MPRCIGAIPAWAGEPKSGNICCNTLWGHPRVGGGTEKENTSLGTMEGPSPRGRGNHGLSERAEAEPGAIPAWAGEPSITVLAAWHHRGHPRVGGGTGTPRAMALSTKGPSPRGRGNPGLSPAAHVTLGAIPAWAGEPSNRLPHVKTVGGHPRVGGGTCHVINHSRSLQGPSPRGRGNLVRRLDCNLRHGAIPAWAGEPHIRPRRRSSWGGHPRVGGGTSDDTFSNLEIDRAIPAWAGEPPSMKADAMLARGHPRVGGGTWLSATPTGKAMGPSPRGRGNLYPLRPINLPDGAIPAWAGEPYVIVGQFRFVQGHPRVGGGTLGMSQRGLADAGPSPRGRGNRGLFRPHYLGRGAIPAWAGEPHGPSPVHQGTRGHPRVGGGTNASKRWAIFLRGPSPRGRGNPVASFFVILVIGAIPAWAGEPAGRPFRLLPSGGHPRVGGGTLLKTVWDAIGSGPSPRGRGNRR